MLAHFLILPSLQGFLMYQLQLTTSQVGLQDISEHRGPAGSLSASSLTPHPPNFGSWAPLMSCPRQAESHLAKPQKHFQLQTAWCSPQRETRPKVEELIRSHHITIRTYSSLIAEQSSFISCFWQKYLWDVYTWSDLAGADMQKHTSPEADAHQSVWIYLEKVLGFIRGLYRITFFFYFTRWKFTTVYEKFYSSALESKSSIIIKKQHSIRSVALMQMYLISQKMLPWVTVEKSLHFLRIKESIEKKKKSKLRFAELCSSGWKWTRGENNGSLFSARRWHERAHYVRD